MHIFAHLDFFLHILDYTPLVVKFQYLVNNLHKSSKFFKIVDRKTYYMKGCKVSGKPYLLSSNISA